MLLDNFESNDVANQHCIPVFHTVQSLFVFWGKDFAMRSSHCDCSFWNVLHNDWMTSSEQNHFNSWLFGLFSNGTPFQQLQWQRERMTSNTILPINPANMSLRLLADNQVSCHDGKAKTLWLWWWFHSRFISVMGDSLQWLAMTAPCTSTLKLFWNPGLEPKPLEGVRTTMRRNKIAQKTDFRAHSWPKNLNILVCNSCSAEHFSTIVHCRNFAQKCPKAIWLADSFPEGLMTWKDAFFRLRQWPRMCFHRGWTFSVGVDFDFHS